MKYYKNIREVRESCQYYNYIFLKPAIVSHTSIYIKLLTSSNFRITQMYWNVINLCRIKIIPCRYCLFMNESAFVIDDIDLTNFILLAINFCANSNGGCEHKCIPVTGSFMCGCKSGYILADNERSCIGRLLRLILLVNVCGLHKSTVIPLTFL